MEDEAPDSPIKGRKDLKFKNFKQRNLSRYSDSGVFSLRFSPDTTFIALARFDGSLQIVSSMLGDEMFKIKDEDMFTPITSLAWKPDLTGKLNYKHRLLGACLNGSIIRWTVDHGDTVEHIKLNEEQRYHAIDYA